MNFLHQHILSKKHSPIRNYGIPGLTSWLIEGKLRLFEASREQSVLITPHSHRYGFKALVLQGQVLNTLYMPGDKQDDLWQVSSEKGRLGAYKTEPLQQTRFSPFQTCYSEGGIYRMKAEEIHSIIFSKDALVLMQEDTEELDASMFIEPVVNGEVIKTLTVEDWMFT